LDGFLVDIDVTRFLGGLKGLMGFGVMGIEQQSALQGVYFFFGVVGDFAQPIPAEFVAGIALEQLLQQPLCGLGVTIGGGGNCGSEKIRESHMLNELRLWEWIPAFAGMTFVGRSSFYFLPNKLRP
jgi:hypothetical protein